MVAVPAPICVTAMVNAGSDAVAVPSLTRIVIPAYDPTFATVGVPCKRPVVVSNVAHAGMFTILKVSVSLLASVAVGVNW